MRMKIQTPVKEAVATDPVPVCSGRCCITILRVAEASYGLAGRFESVHDGVTVNFSFRLAGYSAHFNVVAIGSWVCIDTAVNLMSRTH